MPKQPGKKVQRQTSDTAAKPDVQIEVLTEDFRPPQKYNKPHFGGFHGYHGYHGGKYNPLFPQITLSPFVAQPYYPPYPYPYPYPYSSSYPYPYPPYGYSGYPV